MQQNLIKGSTTSAVRFRAIDWLRGLSVLLMIECHALLFLKPELEHTPLWLWLQNWNGLVSTAFLFAAGFAAGLVGTRGLAMASEPELRAERSRKTLVRIAQVWAVALFFQLSSALRLDGSTAPFSVTTLHNVLLAILKFDILVCICVGLLVVWAVLHVCRSHIGIATSLLAALTLASLALTPWASAYRGNEVLTGWLNSSTGSLFTPFPFIAYLLGGALLGIGAAVFPTRARRVVIGGLIGAVVVAYGLGETSTAIAWWQSLGAWEHVSALPNLFERVWKLGAVGLAFCAIEAAWPFVGRALAAPASLLEYVSRQALPAYFVHRCLLYGFCGIHLTHQWHGNSNWAQYAWRLAALVAATAVLCHAFARAKVAITRARERRALEDAPLPLPVPPAGVIAP